jgi:hypothetical protein
MVKLMVIIILARVGNPVEYTRAPIHQDKTITDIVGYLNGMEITWGRRLLSHAQRLVPTWTHAIDKKNRKSKVQLQHNEMASS